MPAITDARILILATDGFEQSELEIPLTGLRAQGATVHVCAPSSTKEPGTIIGWSNGNWGHAVDVDIKLDTAKSASYDALILPGGVISPDKLRTEQKALDLIRSFEQSGKTIAAICHGPWLLAEAGLARGRRLTSCKSIKTDIRNAGAQWEDTEVVTDDGIITSRSPEDLPAFIARLVEEIVEGSPTRRHQAAA